MTGCVSLVGFRSALANVELKADDLADEDLKKAKSLVPADAAIGNLILKVAKRRSVQRLSLFSPLWLLFAFLPASRTGRVVGRKEIADSFLSWFVRRPRREERKIKERKAFGKMFG